MLPTPIRANITTPPTLFTAIITNQERMRFTIIGLVLIYLLNLRTQNSGLSIGWRVSCYIFTGRNGALSSWRWYGPRHITCKTIPIGSTVIGAGTACDNSTGGPIACARIRSAFHIPSLEPYTANVMHTLRQHK